METEHNGFKVNALVKVNQPSKTQDKEVENSNKEMPGQDASPFQMRGLDVFHLDFDADDKLELEVMKAFEAAGDLKVADLRVYCQNGEVEVRGATNDSHAIEQVHSIAEKVKGVKCVRMKVEMELHDTFDDTDANRKLDKRSSLIHI